MAPTKSAAVSSKKTGNHPAYKEMITQALADLTRNGISRHAIKKYIHANFKGLVSNADSHINTAITRGCETGDFVQPKGSSGPLKLVKKGEKKKNEEKHEPTVAKPRAPAAVKKAIMTKKATGTAKRTATKTKVTSPSTKTKVVSPPTKKIATATATKKNAKIKKAVVSTKSSRTATIKATKTKVVVPVKKASSTGKAVKKIVAKAAPTRMKQKATASVVAAVKAVAKKSDAIKTKTVAKPKTTKTASAKATVKKAAAKSSKTVKTSKKPAASKKT
ncbi:hypothetical protein QVD99_000729 [Batrachochytrium dendrobatidis]|nr:hypothetical protein QVD99_000729 [Batrachochytrium dendrobatidis]